MKTKRIVTISLGVALMAAAAQASSFTGNYSQNFNGMGTGTSAPADWKAYSISGGHSTLAPTGSAEPGILPTGATIKGGTINATLIACTPGSQKSSQGCNRAIGGSSIERALGNSPTGIADMALLLTLTNNLTANLGKLSMDYDIRRRSATANYYYGAPYAETEKLSRYRLFYSLDADSTYSPISSLDPTLASCPNTIGTIHGSVTNFALSRPWIADSSLQLRWFDGNAQISSPDQLIGMENLAITPQPATAILILLGSMHLVRRRRA